MSEKQAPASSFQAASEDRLSREDHPPISNAPRADNISHRKHGSRYDYRAIHIPAPRAPDKPAVPVSNFGRNLEASFCLDPILL